MKKGYLFILVLVLAFLLTGCADTVTIKQTMSNPYGFFSGMWHGFTIVLSWIGSLFSDDIAIYAVNNNGGWYDFGFLLGVSAAYTSSTSAL